MKKQRTKDLERLLDKKFNKNNDFYVFECTYGWSGKEIVDCIIHNITEEDLEDINKHLKNAWEHLKEMWIEIEKE